LIYVLVTVDGLEIKTLTS